MSHKCYTGIGSRKTPDVFLEALFIVGHTLGCRGFTLRSGGAEGADTAFEKGCLLAKGRMDIFLPWKKFNGRSGEGYVSEWDDETRARATAIAASHHPAWDMVGQGGRKLMARNIHQVLGHDLATPSEFVVCYSEACTDIDPASWRGGTALTLKVAMAYNIPCYNFAVDGDAARFVEFLNTTETSSS